MWLILGIMTAGIITGLLLKNRIDSKPITFLLNITIYLLLFFMGVSIGTNPEIINNLGQISLKALTIAIAAILGSILIARLLDRIINKKDEK